MTSDIVAGHPDTQKVWDLIERDFTLRLSLITEKWATDYLKAWNGVFAEGKRRGNSGYYGSALVEMALEEMDKRAKWSYQTCCDIWEMQGRSKSRPFFRAIFDWCLQPMFAVRKGCFTHQLELHKKRTGTSIADNLSPIAGHMARQTSKLKARWNTILEIATSNAENEERLNREGENDRKAEVHREIREALLKPAMTPQQMPTLVVNHSRFSEAGAAFTWRELEIRFQEVQAKAPPQYKVHVHLVRTEWYSGSVGEEWSIGGDLASQKEFEYLASISAQKLGYSHGDNTYKEWLGCVTRWLRETGLDEDRKFVWSSTGTNDESGLTNSTKTLFSERIAELSANYCMSLIAEGTPESSDSRRTERLKTGEPDTKRLVSVRKSPKTPQQLRRTKMIFGAIEAKLKGLKYCAGLDKRNLRLPTDWLDEGCPPTYVQAYRDLKWRKRIHDEKCTYREKYDQASDKEREAIIQGEQVTRRTR